MATEPLASLLRPQSLDEVVGQVKAKELIYTFLDQQVLPSMIFWWPPWCGKTTIAMILANKLSASFFQLSWVTSKKADLQKIIEQAKMNQAYGTATIIFLDEIHRWNKAQQDTLLPYVENGTIILIWATTENPSFTVNNALLSRSKVLVFEALTEQEITQGITQHMETIQSHYPTCSLNDALIQLIAQLANGDIRNAFNILESGLILSKWEAITKDHIMQSFWKPVYYDRDGEEHYNIISAVHKSLRDSDGDAACYRIQRMLKWWEDPLYIARRLLRFASEDIGPADNNALLLANVTYESVQQIGMPECDLFLFQLAIYLAKAPKNNVVYRVAKATARDVHEHGNLPVPMHLRNAPTKLMRDLDYGKWYQYAHNHPDAKVDQTHFPKELEGRKYGI